MPRHGLLFLAILASQSQADSIAPYQQLGWVTREHLPQEHQARLPSFCSGDYLPTKISVVQDDALHMQSDHMDFYDITKNKFGLSAVEYVNTFFFDKSLALIASLHAISFNFLN